MAALVAAILVWWWANHRFLVEPVAGLPALESPCMAPPLPNFKQFPAGAERKDAFFDYLLPWVRCENDQLLRLADALETLRQLPELNQTQRVWLADLCDRYLPIGQCKPDSTDWEALRMRVHAIPASLVLAQAANESAWGTSRFAREANNLFGQWCFTEGCGIVPARQRDGFHYEVQRFSSVSESLRSYMHNLNTHRRYRRFRSLREQFREESRQLSGVQLAEGLEGYSERGLAYIHELQQMIRYNKLQKFERKPGEREMFAPEGIDVP